MYEVSTELSFSAAHQVRNPDGSLESVHGHNYRVRVHARSAALDGREMVVDFLVLAKAAHTVLDRFEHRYLNDVPPFDGMSPTAENIARHLGVETAKVLADPRVEIHRVDVWETDAERAVWRLDR